MITPDHEHYIRFILLLVESGTALLRAITEKALKKSYKTLDLLLKLNKPMINSSGDLTNTQKNILYPSSLQSASIEDLDITLLSFLILNYLTKHLEGNEFNAVKHIRELRNKYHAHACDAKMDTATYTKHWSKLVLIISTVCFGLPTEQQSKYQYIIDSIKNDPLDIKTVVDKIEKLDHSQVFYEKIQQSLADIQKNQERLAVLVDNVQTKAQNTESAVACAHKDVLYIKAESIEMKGLLLQMKERLENHGRITKIVQTVYGKVYLSADDQETVDQAESALLEVSNNTIARKESTNLSHRNLQQKVALFVEECENKGVIVEGVKKGSIIFEFKCLSLTAILELIDYFYSSNFQRRLDEIAQALGDVIGKKISLTSVGIDRMSVQNVITKLRKEKKEYEKVVQFEMSCRSVDGMLHALEVFEEGKANNSLNELSKALSEAIGKPVTLHTSIDMDQMTNALLSIQDDCSSEQMLSHFADDLQDPLSRRDNLNLEAKSRSAAETTQPKAQQASTSDMPELDLNVLSLEHVENIVLSIQPKGSPTDISSLATLSRNRLLIVEYPNKNLHIVDIRRGSVILTQNLLAEPWGIAVLPDDKVAVTLPYEETILILSTDDLSVIHSLPTETSPWRITYHQDELYVLTQADGNTYVLVLNMEGDHLKKLQLDRKGSSNFPMAINTGSIAVSKDQHCLYITDRKLAFVISFSLQGQRIADYHLDRPGGLTVIDDGSLLVCSHTSGTIHHISANLELGYILKSNLPKASSISYDPDKQLVFVSFSASLTIKVFSLIKKPLSVKNQSSPTVLEKITLKGKEQQSIKKQDELLASRAEEEYEPELINKSKKKCNIF